MSNGHDDAGHVSAHAFPPLPKTIPTSRDKRVACGTCTYLNAGDASVCEMCGSEMKPCAHDIQADGSWKCGVCTKLNPRGRKTCTQCQVDFSSAITSSVPSQIFCSRCGFLNDGAAVQCVQCDHTIRSTLDQLSTNLRDSTNLLARDMGMNINVKCPGCLTLCFVPPATAYLRCGSCGTYFASPTIGEVSKFHMSRLASSISSSFRGFFSSKPDSEVNAEDAPVGKLIALGERSQQASNAGDGDDTAPRHEGNSQATAAVETSTIGDAKTVSMNRDLPQPPESSGSCQETPATPFVVEEDSRERKEEEMQIATAVKTGDGFRSECANVGKIEEKSKSLREKATTQLRLPRSPRKAERGRTSSQESELPSAVPIGIAPPEDLVEVEGEIVEL